MGTGRTILSQLSDNELIELVNETQTYPIAEDSPLRKVTIDIYGKDEDDVMHMLTMLPQELMYVLAERLVAYSPRVTIELK